MSKIIIVFAIFALACVNAQDFNRAQAALAGRPRLFGQPVPRFHVTTPEELINSARRPGQDLHANYMSQTSEGGKTVTTLRRNDNGVMRDLQFTN